MLPIDLVAVVEKVRTSHPGGRGRTAEHEGDGHRPKDHRGVLDGPPLNMTIVWNGPIGA